MIRVKKVMSQLNIGFETLVQFLKDNTTLERSEEITINSRISNDQFLLLEKHFSKDAKLKLKAERSKIILNVSLKDFEYQKSKIIFNYRHSHFLFYDYRLHEKYDKLKHLAASKYVKICLDYKKSSFSFTSNKSIELIIKTFKKLIDEESKNINQESEIIWVSLKDLFYSEGQAIYTEGKKRYHFNHRLITPLLNEHKGTYTNQIVGIRIDEGTRQFSICNGLEELLKWSRKFRREELLSFLHEDEKNNVEIRNDINIGNGRKKIYKKENEIIVRIPLLSIQFDDNKAIIKFEDDYYSCFVFNSNAYADLLNTYVEQYGCIISDIQEISNISVPVRIIRKYKEFSFEGIDLDIVFQNIKRKYIKKVLSKKTDCSSSSFRIENIEFFDGFYLIWVLNNGERNSLIAPLRIQDNHSSECLKFIHKYLFNRFPVDIQIYYDGKSVLGLSEPYKLSQYIKILYQNINVDGKWSEEVKNFRISSHKEKVNNERINKEISLRNSYLDYLSGIQNQRKIIKDYEVRLNQKEDVFIFSFDLNDGKVAIVFENASFDATATKLFVVEQENLLVAIELISGFFRNSKITNKRQSLNYSLNPPSKFKAINYYSINHVALKLWIKRLNEILVRPIYKKSISLNKGLHLSEEPSKRKTNKEDISIRHVHNEIMRWLYEKLCLEYGTENVGTENFVGSKRIDVVVKVKYGYDIYEIKSSNNPRDCVREAMGQILDYAYFECKDRINKLIIVGPSMITDEVDRYLSIIRELTSLEIYYIHCETFM